MNTAADLEAEDQRVEVLAHRHMALQLSLAFNEHLNDDNCKQVLRNAEVIDAFLKLYPANGEAAFNTALALSRRRTTAPHLDELLACAIRCVTYLETGFIYAG
ncbi:MAG: hypothetical protein RL490_1452 [Pseudomonadota bacterium]|jgi:hypothetical protein